MTVPVAAPVADKGEPLRVGAGVAVPEELQRVDFDALEWVDDVARLRVRWPGARGLQLRLEAEGIWAPESRVRVLDESGAPLHRDSWAPSSRALWVSPAGSSDTVILEFSTHPGGEAELAIAAATTRIR